MSKLRIANIVGARPNFMKIAPLIAEYQKHPMRFDAMLIHTGQHYDAKMSDLFFDQLGLPKPDVDLGVGSGSHAEQTARIMIELEKLLLANRPDLVLVVGDVNSTMAGALVAAKLCIPIAHVEAGLRSNDRTMPEEINRVVTDALSDYCFTTSADADDNLLREGVAAEKIFLVGNVMIDTLLKLKDASTRSDILQRVQVIGDYGYVTLHRPANVDDRARLMAILAALEEVQKEMPLIFPVHPRTRNRLQQFGLWDAALQWRNLRITEPLGYCDSLHLIANAKVVLTDSGGVQEETTVLGIPCLTVRPNTERPITVTQGTNTLVGADHAQIVEEIRKVLAGHGKRGRIPILWDGRAAERIVQCLLRQPPKQ